MLRGQRIQMYLDTIYERRKLAGAVFLAVVVVSGLFALWTRQYSASAIVARTRQSSPQDRLRASALNEAQNALTDERLGAIGERLYPEMVRTHGEASAVRSMHSRISLQTPGGGRNNSEEVRISYRGQDRATVIAVTNALAQSLSEVKTGGVDLLPEGTAAKIERQLEDSRAELKSFAAQQHTRTGEQQLQAGLSKSEGLQTSLQEDAKKLDALEQQRRDQRRPASSARLSGSPPESSAAKAIQQQIKDAEARLIELRQRYTDEYPDVQDTKEQIAELRSKLNRLPAEDPGAKEVMATRDERQITRQEEEIRADQARLENEVRRNTAETEALRTKLAKSPNFVRAYALQLDRYQALVRAQKTVKEYQDKESEALQPLFTMAQGATRVNTTGAAVNPLYWLASLLAGLFAASLSILLAHRLKKPRSEQIGVRNQFKPDELAPKYRQGVR